MDGAEILRRLADGSLPPRDFSHYNHIRVACHCLARWPLPEATENFCAALRAYVKQFGVEDKFHVTLTQALMRLIHSRTGHAGDWESFVASNADLFDDARGLLGRHYSPARLMSEAARKTWVEPDLRPLP